MKEIYLPLTYSINAAEIFLNIFNLRLKIDDIEQILPNYTIEVWDSNKKKGTLTFQNYQFQIQANTPFGTLVANSNLPRRMRIPDDEVNESLDTWDHIVKFSIKSQNESCEMNGEVRLVCNDDTEYGSSCSCHSTFALTKKSNETQQDEKIEMCFLRNGSTFSCYYQTPNHREKILVSPLTFSTLFMEHDKWVRMQSEKRAMRLAYLFVMLYSLFMTSLPRIALEYKTTLDELGISLQLVGCIIAFNLLHWLVKKCRKFLVRRIGSSTVNALITYTYCCVATALIVGNDIDWAKLFKAF